MNLSYRSVRRFLGIGYGNPHSWTRKFLSLAVLFALFVLISFLTIIQSSDDPRVSSLQHGGHQQRYRFFSTNVQRKIDGQDYPKLSSGGKFIPIRKIVHLDLKGGAFKPSFFPQLFEFFKKIGLTGVLIEWEDMFPYTGKLASAINGYAYSISDVEMILRSAKANNLDVIPLVQTFGHLEWILKLKEFKHLREDPKYPQVICFANDEAFSLIKEMIDQVSAIHKKYGMKFFHMGADEAFQVGYCKDTIAQMNKESSKSRVMLWHISRIAKYIKFTHSTTVLAWHDMFGTSDPADIQAYNMTEYLEPVLWAYPENLDEFLDPFLWQTLKPFKNVWGSSAFKGADGPMRYYSNPMHYIKNHESWIQQMTKVYKEFDYFQGLIITGWSRYDHMAVLAELLPVMLPTLVMSVETIDAGRPLNKYYQKSNQLLQCAAKFDLGYSERCKFPGSRIYELINQMHQQKEAFQQYVKSDFEFNGWLSKSAVKYNYSSRMYIEKISEFIDINFLPLERMERALRKEMGQIYFNETIDEFILTYLSDELEFLKKCKAAIPSILSTSTFQKRPFIKYFLKK